MDVPFSWEPTTLMSRTSAGEGALTPRDPVNMWRGDVYSSLTGGDGRQRLRQIDVGLMTTAQQ